MKHACAALILASFLTTGCREIWYYEPQDSTREKRDGYPYWVDRGDVQIGTVCPFTVAPWNRGEEAVLWGFKLLNTTDAELRIENVHLRVGDLRIRPMYVPEDKTNGSRVPARGESEYSVWFNYPERVADRPSSFILAFDLATPKGVRTEEITYSN